ncbi:MAG: aminotransferase class V-fold PLP-dependent enzyme [Chlorobi bacterium]|nr:aminotransferase class V-fold PLP-dependent enzyme [Chlorobiota bacterium]MCI0715685.1 aminotransferase class V-fold PLP-dependent enzyme [Chlorobiota bacterium]
MKSILDAHSNEVSLNGKNTFENHYDTFRNNIIGYHTEFETPYGIQPLIYADWTASGRLYRPIEEKITNLFGQFVGNTHTETNVTGTSMTLAYMKAKRIIKQHVNANDSDAMLCTGSGMTGALLKLERMLGFKVPSRLKNAVKIPDELRPVVFVTHMEHHSNQTTWLETIAKVEIIKPDINGLVDLNDLKHLLKKYKDSRFKIASITSCSNVTGIFTLYYEIAEMMHENGGWCFVDFACSAPYIKVNMHPENPMQSLDAIFFSPHKFLGGPGAAGVLIFNKSLYDYHFAPDQPGGGTVKWTNPWGEHSFYEDIELREDGGTPPFLQTIKAALAVKLKDEMNSDIIMKREKIIKEYVFERLKKVPNINILAENIKERLAIVSFYIDKMHYNLGVRLLNDRFGIQVRGGCSCAGTYGHYLLHVSKSSSKKITDMIEHDDLSAKPGWIRLSLHPVMSDAEIEYIVDSVEKLARHHNEWGKDYAYNCHSNYYVHKSKTNSEEAAVNSWFDE